MIRSVLAYASEIRAEKSYQTKGEDRENENTTLSTVTYTQRQRYKCRQNCDFEDVVKWLGKVVKRACQTAWTGKDQPTLVNIDDQYENCFKADLPRDGLKVGSHS